MDIRHLRYFVALAEYGGVRAAAGRLFVSQPAVSRRLRDLEAEVGVALYQNTPKGMRLTHAGHAFRDVAENVLTSLEDGVQQVRAIGHGRAGRLRLGFVDNATWDGRLGRILGHFRQAEPDVALELEPMNSPQQEEALAREAIDGAFVYPFSDLSNDYRCVELARYPLVLAWPNAHGVAPSTLVEASAHPFIGFPRRTYPAYYDQLQTLWADAGVTLDIVQSATTEAAILSLVAAGVGAALVNGANRYRPPQGVGFHDLADIALELPLCFVYRPASASPALMRFVDSLSDA